MLKISVLGAGRMGRAIAHEMLGLDDLELVGVWAREGKAAAAEFGAAR